ncbi:MAG: hypothetical protein VYD18_11150 [Candidatus Latescibacterota bacterium]|nr:hypothetical protein [Candidatus Latescibacterota bacterium]
MLEAIQRAQEHILAGYDWVVDLDLERFFDRVKDKQMARLIRRVETGGQMGDDFGGELSVQTASAYQSIGRRAPWRAPGLANFWGTPSRRVGN